MQVEREGVAIRLYSGKRVSNSWVTYPLVGDNSPKGVLIPTIRTGLARGWWKAEPRVRHRRMGSCPISLLAGQGPTKATRGRCSERTASHTDTATAPRRR